MKIIFALTLGTIAMLLAVTAQDSLIARLLLASVGLALYAVALIPVAVGSEQKASRARKLNVSIVGVMSGLPYRKQLEFLKEPF
ncbi:hypothetical protein [Halomonas alkaliantarctica]|uniref:hypothetical protein n=1 Tax=Halomonas alkaliantarctica TaxID=232346 RepID=UPI0004AAED0E|nr:hypothetical protein [Halomonas alkaliantarctica]